MIKEKVLSRLKGIVLGGIICFSVFTINSYAGSKSIDYQYPGVIARAHATFVKGSFVPGAPSSCSAHGALMGADAKFNNSKFQVHTQKKSFGTWYNNKTIANRSFGARTGVFSATVYNSFNNGGFGSDRARVQTEVETQKKKNSLYIIKK